jgi:hypothetical protein
VVCGFDLPEVDAISILRDEFNPRCLPPWSEKELLHKVRQATQQGGERGYLIGQQSHASPSPRSGGSAAGTSSVARSPEPERPPKRSDFVPEALRAAMARGFTPDFLWLAERSPLDPCEITSAAFLDAVFQPGEKTLVFTSYFSQGEFGHVAGSPGQTYVIGRRPGIKPVSGATLPKSAREGAWFLPNPVDARWYPGAGVDPKTGNPVMSRRSGAGVTAWRHLLLESDEAAAAEWLNFITGLPIPITALYTSGDRSIHALVKIDTDSKSQFDAFRDRISPFLSRVGADPAAMSGVRLTRLPGVMREGRRNKQGNYHPFNPPRLQRLLYLNPEPAVSPLRTMPRLREIKELASA